MKKNKRGIDPGTLKSFFMDKKRLIPVKRLLPILAVLILIIIALTLAAHWFHHSPHFRIADVNVVDPVNAVETMDARFIASLKGHNIFEVDLQNFEKLIIGKHPEVKKVLVMRLLPDTIAIEVIPRVPIAKIKELRYFPIDKEGVVLSPDMKANGQMPVIIGLVTWSALKTGERLESRQIKLAIELITQFEKATSEFSIITVNIGSLYNITFTVDRGPLVKIGTEEYPERIENLLNIMKDPKVDLQSVDYIDLRFKDNIIIKPKIK